MRKFWIGWVFVFVSVNLMGCGVMDWFFGVDKSEQKDDGKGGGGKSNPSESPAAGIGSVLKYFVPGADTVLVGIAGIWAALRGRKYKLAAESTAWTLMDFKETEIGSQAWEKLKKMLEDGHDEDGIKAFVASLLAKVKFERAVAPKAPEPSSSTG